MLRSVGRKLKFFWFLQCEIRIQSKDVKFVMRWNCVVIKICMLFRQGVGARDSCIHHLHHFFALVSSHDSINFFRHPLLASLTLMGSRSSLVWEWLSRLGVLFGRRIRVVLLAKVHYLTNNFAISAEQVSHPMDIKEQWPTCLAITCFCKATLRLTSTRTLTKWPNDPLRDCSSILRGLPIAHAIPRITEGCQYSLLSSYMRIHTWAVRVLILYRLKSGVHWDNQRIPDLTVHVLRKRALVRSSFESNWRLKKPLPSGISFHFQGVILNLQYSRAFPLLITKPNRSKYFHITRLFFR